MDEMKEIDTLLQLNLVLEAKKILAPEKEVIRVFTILKTLYKMD